MGPRNQTLVVWRWLAQRRTIRRGIIRVDAQEPYEAMERVERQLFHDLRRTAIRNLIRSGVSQQVAQSSR
jgi:hypothetical protein